MAVVQAMYAGLPVVVTPEVALSREVAAAGAGLVVKKDAVAFAEAVLKILRDPGGAHRMGVRGKAFVQGILAPKVAGRFMEEYAKLVNHA